LLDLKHLASFRQANEDFAREEIAKFEDWQSSSHPHEADRERFVELQAFLAEAGYSIDEEKHTHDWKYLLNERGWTVLQNLYRQDYITVAIKSRGVHSGKVMVTHGWNWSIALAFALAQAIRVDQGDGETTD